MNYIETNQPLLIIILKRLDPRPFNRLILYLISIKGTAPFKTEKKGAFDLYEKCNKFPQFDIGEPCKEQAGNTLSISQKAPYVPFPASRQILYRFVEDLENRMKLGDSLP